MSDQRGRSSTAWAVAACAIALAAVGVGLLFGGTQTVGVLFRGSDANPLGALLGAALVGVGAMTWIARRSLLGGIYGRAVVVGNQVHFVVGALVLLKYGLATGGPPALWTLTALYFIGASLFSYLLVRTGPRSER